MEDKKIIKRLKEHLEVVLKQIPNDWFCICLQGSQNYGLANKDSDIDSKLLTIPTVEEIVFNKKPVNFTYHMENDEHVDVKDIREYFKILRKQNVNFVEILFTDYYLVNPKYIDIWEVLRENAELIAHGNEYRFFKCAKGMVLEKAHALCHPYPSKLPLLEKYGWDGKQLSHAERIANFMVHYKDFPYAECLKMSMEPSSYHNYLMNLKRNKYPKNVEDARSIMDSLVEFVTVYEKTVNSKQKDVFSDEADRILNECLFSVITYYLRTEL